MTAKTLVGKFRRITRDGRWIAQIDGVRFVAIMSVVLFHLLGELVFRSGGRIQNASSDNAIFWLIWNGNRGVSLFFIISGFVLALPFARYFFKDGASVSLQRYFMRRLTRLEVPYLLSLLIFCAGWFIHARSLTPFILVHAAATAFYVHSLIYGTPTFINPVAWSLEVEIQFYIVAPILMQLFRIKRPLTRRGVFCGLIAGMSIAQLGVASQGRAYWSILHYGQFFLMGLLLADLYMVDGDLIRPSVFWDAAGILGLVLSFSLPSGFITLQVVLPWVMALILFGSLWGKLLSLVFGNPWVSVLGGMCYSIYILHFQLIALIFKATRFLIVPNFDLLGNYLIQILVTGVPVILISACFFVLVERPCMDPNWPSKLRNRLTRRNRAEILAIGGDGTAVLTASPRENTNRRSETQ